MKTRRGTAVQRGQRVASSRKETFAGVLLISVVVGCAIDDRSLSSPAEAGAYGDSAAADTRTGTRDGSRDAFDAVWDSSSEDSAPSKTGSEGTTPDGSDSGGGGIAGAGGAGGNAIVGPGGSAVSEDASSGSGGTRSSGGGPPSGGKTGSGGSTDSDSGGPGGTIEGGGIANGGDAGCGDVVSSPQNCGRCGHDCGAGAGCQGGACLPAVLYDGIDDASLLAVNASGIYFALHDQLSSCDLTGCRGMAPHQLINNQTFGRVLELVNGRALFVRAIVPGVLNSCPDSGCSTPLPELNTNPGSGNAVSQLVVAGSDVFYSISGKGITSIYRCTLPTTTCAITVTVNVGSVGGVNNPFAVDSLVFYSSHSASEDSLVACASDGSRQCTTLTTHDTNPVYGTSMNWTIANFLGASGGYVYAGFASEVSLATKSHISVCPATGCAVAATFAGLVDPLIDMAVDESGVYWLQGDAFSASLQYCPLSGCIGGARVLATSLQSAHALRIYGDFVYWISGGTPVDGGTPVPGTGSIVRVAR